MKNRSEFFRNLSRPFNIVIVVVVVVDVVVIVVINALAPPPLACRAAHASNPFRPTAKSADPGGRRRTAIPRQTSAISVFQDAHDDGHDSLSPQTYVYDYCWTQYDCS